METLTRPTIRRAAERGHADFGWLDSRHTFSFGQYHDPRHVHFHALRVINDDRVAGGGGFPTHPHQDAEIFSYVLDGALEHRDTMGNGSTVAAGGVQFMSAGSGVAHSEANASATEPVRFLQVWLIPDERGAEPRYATRDLSAAEKDGRLALFLSPEGEGDAIPLRTDARVFAATLDGPQRIEHPLPEGRAAWVQVARGSLKVNGARLAEGDGAAIEEPGAVVLEQGEGAELLLFDLAER